MDTSDDTKEYLKLLELYKPLAENAVDCIWLFDLTDMCFKYISPSVMQILGLTADQMMNGKLQDHFTPETLSIFRTHTIEKLPQFLTGNRSESIVSSLDEYTHHHIDGTLKVVEISTKLVYNENTTHIEVIGITRDITARKIQEQNRINEEKEKLLKNLLNELEQHNEINNEPKKFSVNCFGKFTVYGYCYQAPIKWRTAKSEELFAFLVENRDIEISKWKICEALWPEYSEEKVNTLLHTTIYKMKNSLTSANIRFDLIFVNRCYKLTLYNVCIDTDEFDSITASDFAITKDTIDAYEKVFALYKNNYLEDDGYPWSLYKSEFYYKKYYKLALSLVNYYIEKNDYSSAERILRIISAKSPLDEFIHEMILKLYFIKKDRTSFITYYNTIQEMFQCELGIELSDSIQALYYSILCFSE